MYEKGAHLLPSSVYRGSHMTRKARFTVLLVVLAVVAVIVYTQVTIFVVPPMGAVPEGKTLVISRLNKTEFVDSADAMCERLQGRVSLLCRGMVLDAVAKNATIHLRLPYNDSL
jgi:hypothetical protein